MGFRKSRTSTEEIINSPLYKELVSRMQAATDLEKNVFVCKQRLMRHFHEYCEHMAAARDGGWEWRLIAAAQAKAEIIAQASYDVFEATRRFSYDLFHLPTEYVTKEGIPDYVRDLYREYRNDHNPRLNFTPDELLVVSYGTYNGVS